jgi:uncharacterized membrane protein
MPHDPSMTVLGPVLAPLERSSVLDRARPMVDQARALMPTQLRDALSGDWLGHPLHPALTDLPIGFWTSASLLDLAGRRARRAATVMVGLGVATAAPTAAAGLVDWGSLDPKKQRVAVVHAGANLVATGLYAASFMKRLGGRRGAGVALALAGMAVATAGGYLGGHLAFGDNATADDADEQDAGGSFADGPSLLAPSFERAAR